MSITASIILTDSPMPDGRRFITERHTDHLGVFHFRTYICLQQDTPSNNLPVSATNIAQVLRSAEIEANMVKALNGETDTFIFQHSTVAQNRSRLRELFKTATKFELITLGYVLHTMDLSDNQLKLIFEINDAQLPALKAKLADCAQKYQDILTVVGQ